MSTATSAASRAGRTTPCYDRSVVEDAMHPERQSTTPPVILEVGPQLQADALNLRYEARNGRGKPIYLLNVLWAWDRNGKYVPSPSPVYACMKGKNQLHLALQVLPLPRRREVELRNVPFATKVEAGQSFSKSLRLPLPIDEYNTYFPATEESRYQDMAATELVFSLQFVEELDGLKVQAALLPEALRLHHPQLLARVETLQSKALPMQVPVRKRLDEFEEF